MRRGDTIIEVMLAMALLGAVILGVMGVMNYAHSQLETSLNRSHTQAVMESQLDIVRYARDQFVLNVQPPNPGRNLWDDLAPHIHSSAPNATVCADNRNDSWAGDHLSITSTAAGFAVANASAAQRLSDFQPEPGDGMWVELGESVTPGMIDVAIKACAVGLGSQPELESKIIITLVDPR